MGLIEKEDEIMRWDMIEKEDEMGLIEKDDEIMRWD